MSEPVDAFADLVHEISTKAHFTTTERGHPCLVVYGAHAELEALFARAETAIDRARAAAPLEGAPL